MSEINPNNLTREQLKRHLKAAKKAHDTDSVAKLSAMLAELGGPGPPGKETKGEKCARLIEDATEARDMDSAKALQTMLAELKASGRADEPWDAPEKIGAGAPVGKPIIRKEAVRIASEVLETAEKERGLAAEREAAIGEETEPEPQEGPPPVFLATILAEADADLLANAKHIVTLQELEEFFDGADSPDVALQSVEGIGRVTSARILDAITAFRETQEAPSAAEKELESDASEIAWEAPV